MLQDTVRRLAGLEVGAPMVVCNEAHRFLVAEQLRAIDCKPRAIVLEPAGRNTAPAIALAAHATLAAEEGDPLLLVLPADHVIPMWRPFTRDRVASAAARDGALVTFGIVPTSPETGYGYIRRGSARRRQLSHRRVRGKARAARAQAFLASGEYYWNSGMFLFRARRYLEELEKFAPDIAAACGNSFAGAVRDLDFTRVDPAAFRDCRSESIDYAVMEKTSDAVVVPLDAGWSDVGNWTSLHAACEHDAQGNALFGDVMVEDTHDSYVYSVEPFGGDGGPARSCGGRDQGCGTGGARRIGCRTSRSWSRGSKPLAATSIRCIARFPPLGQLRQHRRRRALSGQASDGASWRGAVAADASSPRRALGRGFRYRQRSRAARRPSCSRRINPPTFLSACAIASRIRDGFRCISSRCSRAATWAKTTSCAWKTAMGARVPTPSDVNACPPQGINIARFAHLGPTGSEWLS
jgi:mannose-1-phosphate guanylyltransferase